MNDEAYLQIIVHKLRVSLAIYDRVFNAQNNGMVVFIFFKSTPENKFYFHN